MSYAHARRLALCSWPLYAVATLGCLSGCILAMLPFLPTGLRAVAGIEAAVAAWFGVASFFAFHWMFDRSRLLDGIWLRDLVPANPKRWVQLSVCLDETTLPLETVFPTASGVLLDLYHPSAMTEPAVMRARPTAGKREVTSARPEAVPVEDGWADVVVVTLLAHEMP